MDPRYIRDVSIVVRYAIISCITVISSKADREAQVCTPFVALMAPSLAVSETRSSAAAETGVALSTSCLLSNILPTESPLVLSRCDVDDVAADGCWKTTQGRPEI